MDIKLHKVTGITFDDMVFDNFVTRKIVIESDESGKIEIVLFSDDLKNFEMVYKGVEYVD